MFDNLVKRRLLCLLLFKYLLILRHLTVLVVFCGQIFASIKVNTLNDLYVEQSEFHLLLFGQNEERLAVVLLYCFEVVVDSFKKSRFKHLPQGLCILIVKSVNKSPIRVMEHRVLLVVVVENGAFEVPPS